MRMTSTHPKSIVFQAELILETRISAPRQEPDSLGGLGGKSVEPGHSVWTPISHTDPKEERGGGGQIGFNFAWCLVGAYSNAEDEGPIGRTKGKIEAREGRTERGSRRLLRSGEVLTQRGQRPHSPPRLQGKIWGVGRRGQFPWESLFSLRSKR